MDVEEFPLLDLFIKLNDAGLSLGIDDYKSVLKALQGGFGQEPSSLKRICKALWVISPDEEHLFNYHFSQIEGDLLQQQENLRLELQSQHIENSDDFDLDLSLDEPEDLGQEEQLEEEELKETEDEEEPEVDLPTPPSESQDIQEMEDETETVQAINAIQVEARDLEFDLSSIRTRFVLSGNYLPITRRQMKQNWRYLRRFIREGRCEELDLDATIHEIGRSGFFLKPIMIPRRRNRVELLMLLDQGGSMAPFHALTERLKHTAMRGGRLGKASNAYYFHDCPTRGVYHDSARIETVDISQLISKLHANYTLVMIVSDAGAARGWFSDERLESTQRFLKQLRSHVASVVWLNPMPRFRWLGTTAGEIKRYVPMFEMSRRGLDHAITTLRKGK